MSGDGAVEVAARRVGPRPMANVSWILSMFGLLVLLDGWGNQVSVFATMPSDAVVLLSVFLVLASVVLGVVVRWIYRRVPGTLRVDSKTLLWIEDTTQPAQLRAAALIALRQSLDEPEGARLRVLANACASPKLRVAFEAAGAGGASSVTEALEDLEDGERGPAKRSDTPSSSARRAP